MNLLILLRCLLTVGLSFLVILGLVIAIRIDDSNLRLLAFNVEVVKWIESFDDVEFLK